jgi:hypothetical protein
MAFEICRIEVQQNRVGAWGPTGLGPEPRECAERRAAIWAQHSPHNAYRVVAVDAPTPRTPAEAFATAGQAAIKAARGARAARAQAVAQAVAQALPPEGARFSAVSEPGPWAQARPVLPGEALPPAPPAQAGPAPQLPTIRPPATPAELRAQAAELETEALEALQALARIPALARSAADIRSMARQLVWQADGIRRLALAREATA